MVFGSEGSGISSGSSVEGGVSVFRSIVFRSIDAMFQFSEKHLPALRPKERRRNLQPAEALQMLCGLEQNQIARPERVARHLPQCAVSID
jgi:hypothetical protein